MDKQEWDVSVTQAKSSEIANTVVPAAIARALRAEGMNRARVTVTKDGILYRPYKGVSTRAARKLTVSLPFAK